MSEPVDTTAEAVEPVSHDQLATLCIAFGALAQRTQADSELQVLSALRELQALRRERAEQETLLAERNRQNAAAFGERDKLRKLAAFGERCLDAFQDCYSDLDGGWIQDTAVECGVLVEVTATEPCDPEHCECAGMTDFPTKCYRRAPDIEDASTSPELQEAGRLIESFPTSIRGTKP